MRTILCWFMAVVLAGNVRAAAAEADEPTMDIRAGIGGYVKVGRWAPITVFTRDERVKSLQVEASDPVGNLARFPLRETNRPDDARRVFRGLFQVGRLRGLVRLRITLRDGTRYVRRLTRASAGTQPGGSDGTQPGGLRRGNDSAGSAAEIKPPLRQSVALIVTVGKPAGFKNLSRFGDESDNSPGDSPQREDDESATSAVRVVELDRAAQLPVGAGGFDALNAVVIAGPYTLDRQQDAALRRWVREGGHLVVCRGSRLDVFVQESLRRVAPAGFGNGGGLALDPVIRAAMRETSRETAAPSQNEARQKGSTNAAFVTDHLLAAWLPVTILGQTRYRGDELSGILRSYTGEKTAAFLGRIPGALIRDPTNRPDRAGLMLTGRVVQRRIVQQGQLLQRDRTMPLIVRLPYGFGEITFCGLDFDRPPLSTWGEAGALGRRILEETLSAVNSSQADGGERVSRTGVTDLATQLHAIQQEFPGVRRMSAWRTMSLLLLYILLIGPLDYLVVHRWLKRPRLTWLTFPALVITITYFSVWNAEDANGTEVRLNQLDVVDIDATPQGSHETLPAEPNVLVRSWFTLYSPETRRYQLALKPRSVMSSPRRHKAGTGRPRKPRPQPAADTGHSILCWSGTTENVFGGMYRTGRLQMGTLSYTIDSPQRRLRDLPLRIWSAQTFVSTQRRSRRHVVHSRLVQPRGRRLTGTITHHLAVPMTDWILVYDKFVYRPESDNVAPAVRTIKPGMTWSVDQPGIVQYLLENDLKRSRFERTSGDDPLSSTTRQVQQEYDPTGRDLDDLLRVLTFHRNLRGSQYTGLDNIPLATMDWSRLLPMKRAVLIGRISTPATHMVQLGEPPSQRNTETAGPASPDAQRPRSIQPTQTDTFVRILLPVWKE